MTIEDFLTRLDGVRRNGKGYMGRCPAHQPDRTPSLSVREGDRGILVKCWAGCRLEDIADAVGLTVCDLFYYQPQDPREWKETQRKRRVERERREDRAHALGLSIDCAREADYLLASARNPGLVDWTDEDLHEALNVVADALEILFAEKVNHGDYPF